MFYRPIRLPTEHPSRVDSVHPIVVEVEASREADRAEPGKAACEGPRQRWRRAGGLWGPQSCTILLPACRQPLRLVVQAGGVRPRCEAPHLTGHVPAVRRFRAQQRPKTDLPGAQKSMRCPLQLRPRPKDRTHRNHPRQRLGKYCHVAYRWSARVYYRTTAQQPRRDRRWKRSGICDLSCRIAGYRLNVAR